MRTTRTLTISRSMLCAGGGCLLRGCLVPGVVSGPGGVCSRGCLVWGCLVPGVSGPGGCLVGGVWSRGCLLRGGGWGGVCSGGCLLLGGYLVWGVCLVLGGVWSGGGVCLSAYWDTTPPRTRHLPLWSEFLTHAYENITLSQLRLRAVIKQTSLKIKKCKKSNSSYQNCWFTHFNPIRHQHLSKVHYVLNANNIRLFVGVVNPPDSDQHNMILHMETKSP